MSAESPVPLGEASATGPMLRLLRMLPARTRAQMVGMYRDSLRAQLATLEGALTAGAAPDSGLVALVHKLAGSAAMMQDADLSLPARAIEKALGAGAIDEARSHWPAVRAAADRTLAALEEA
jgi:HPt (histidine-containing phosphotransfer) domain-containing protein